MDTLVVGAGFSGACIAARALESGTVTVTRRSASSLDEFSAQGMSTCVFDGELQAQLRDALSRATHLVVTVAPARIAPLNDPVLQVLDQLGKSDMPELQWIGYLSTIGVYGDHAGAWIDESADCRSVQLRSQMRLQAESGWLAFAGALELPISVLRLSGIYGPGRNTLEDALRGRARMLIKPGQVFNRIHVHDLAEATLLAAHQLLHGVINITDDLPAAPQDVVCLAHDLLDKPYPPAQDFASAPISEMARSFYSENKRVSNALSKSMLGMRYRFPTYREGLESIHKQMSLQS